MLCRPTAIFRLCLNKKWPLRKQLMVSFLSLSAVSLVLALAVVLLTTFIIGNKAEREARNSLEDQIERHLTDASTEAAATIGERFRRLQNSVLDITSFALKDALQEDLILDGGSKGYPLSPAHTDLRDTQIDNSDESNLESFNRADEPVDLTRSVWYYTDGTSTTAAIEPGDDAATIAKSARLDLLWPTMYINSNDTSWVYVALPLETSGGSAFRIFPGKALSSVEGTLFACSDPDIDGCFDSTKRKWYEDATAAGVEVDAETGLGGVIVTDPYIDAAEAQTNWLVTLARAVYADDNSLLGVVGVDVRLEKVQLSIEGLNFLTSGYSILATAANGTVLAAPDDVWDRNVEEETDTLCNLESGICSGGSGWEDLIQTTQDDVFKFKNDGGKGEEYILVTAPVEATFELETGNGAMTHYILSAVPVSEVFEPVEGMAELIRKSTTQIMATTGFVALATLCAVGVAVCILAGNITRPIKKMTEAARSIAKDGAKTNVFGGVAANWGAGRDGGGGQGGSSSSGSGFPRRTRVIDYLLCRGEDEIDTLVREFSLMITGLGRRGKASTAIGLEDTSVYPKNPFTTSFERAPPTAPASDVTASAAS